MHPLSTTRLVLGLLCLGFSGLWLADQAGWVGDSRYLFPGLLILVGLVSLLAFAVRGHSRRRRDLDLDLDRRDDLNTTYTETDQEALR